MFKKQKENRQVITDMKKECFNARKQLIVISDKVDGEKIGCIKLKYEIVNYLQDPWIAGVNPENTYRIMGPRIDYCFSFNSKNPLKSTCRCTSCPMYDKYQKYLNTVKSLQFAKEKIK